MDLPVTIDELRIIVASLQRDEQVELADKLNLVAELYQEGKPYKKILREEYGIVA